MTTELNTQRMSAQEAVMLCRLAKAACPQQQFDQYTPDMWHELLGDLRFQDARDALVMVCKKQPFVSPAEIRDMVSEVRRERIIAFGYLRPPAELDDNWAAAQAWLRETKRRIGDGELKPGDPLEPPSVTLDRVMPNWDRMLPRPEQPTRAEIAKEAKTAKPADHDRRMAEVRAELAARGEVKAPQPEPPTPELCGLDDCQRGAGHTGPCLPPVTKEDEG